jgi:formate C-acetyltransferase
MNKRIEKLRQESLNTQPYISIQRASLVTEAYKKYEGTVSIPVLRALVFEHVLENKSICIGEGELIVGERGEHPQATPTFPELCCHTLEDLELINNRKKISFAVNQEVKGTQKEKIIPYWKNRSIRSRIFKEMTPEWKDSYTAGIFTEFMEQRAPGHTVADDKIYHKGFSDFIRDIDKSMQNLDYLNDPEAYDKQEELKAMLICAKAIIRFAERYAEKALEMAEAEKNPQRKKELQKITEVCLYVPANPPRNFWEALQMYWFVHLGVITELNTWDSFNPGRLDQHLYPFYKKGMEEGR